MCYYKTKVKDKALIAEKNIVVYKITMADYFTPTGFFPPFRRTFRYVFGLESVAKIKHDGISINEGLHSYKEAEYVGTSVVTKKNVNYVRPNFSDEPISTGVLIPREENV